MSSPGFTIAVDFDGTLAEHGAIYPEIGPEIPWAVRWCLAYQNAGALLFLWTMRDGEGLDLALRWCADRGLSFWGVNENPYQDQDWAGPKQFAHVYIDDMAAAAPLVYPADGRRAFLDWSGRWPHSILGRILDDQRFAHR